MRFLFLLFLFPLVSTAQIQIDKAGDFWELRVDSALKMIKSIDTIYYSRILQVCDRVSFWNNIYSSCEGDLNSKGTILISSKDVSSGNMYNICAVLVHESAHLKLIQSGLSFEDPDAEEVFCYRYELEFLRKIPGVSKSLIRHAETQIKKFSYQ